MALYWLSFVDHDRPEDQALLGVVLVEADGFADAVGRTWQHGCNPGGDVNGVLLSTDDLSDQQRDMLARTPFLTLLSEQQLDELGWGVVRIEPPEEVG